MEAEIGVIGGSGLYSMLDGLDSSDEREFDTPYGAPSGPITVGRVGPEGAGRTVAFVARHGPNHTVPPHAVNYRANLWALHALGVRRVLGPCAAGSLRATIHPGEIVICDQFVDHTGARPGTFFDGPVVHHVTLADPYCAQTGAVVAGAARRAGMTVHDKGTVVVIPGPRFATRAESGTYRVLGYDVINMTQCPEVALARELGMCYSGIALVTDYDSGVDDRPDVGAVTQAEVFAVFAANFERLRAVLLASIADLPATRSCRCAEEADALPAASLPGDTTR